MAKLGSRYFEIGRGYEKISETYKCPYLLGVDITGTDKPFVVAQGDHHSDSVATQISGEELISGKWDKHIILSNCTEFIEQLKTAMNKKETFPQKFILDLVKK